MEFDQFKLLLEAMIRDNNYEQELLRLFENNPVIVIQYLLQLIQSFPNQEISIYSIILLGRLIFMIDNFVNIGNEEFHNFFQQSLIKILSNPIYSEYSQSLISNLFSKVSLIYYNCSYNFSLLPYLIPLFQSGDVRVASVSIETLFLCINNGSINSNESLQIISEIIFSVLSDNQFNYELCIPTLKLLYITFENIPHDFSSQIIQYFGQVYNNDNALNKTIYDLVAYLPQEKYNFFSNSVSWFIPFFSNLLLNEKISIAVKYCILEIIYNFSLKFYEEFVSFHEVIIDGIYSILYFDEPDSFENKFIISEISIKYGGLANIAIYIYNKFINNLNNEDIRKSIAAMKLFSYCYCGIFTHLSIYIIDEYFELIFNSNVLHHPMPIVRSVAFKMLGSLFKQISQKYSTFEPSQIFSAMISLISNVDPSIMALKLKIFSYYLVLLDESFLEEISDNVIETLFELSNSATEEQLNSIIKCLKIFSNVCTRKKDQIMYYFFEIISNPKIKSNYFLSLECLSEMIDDENNISQIDPTNNPIFNVETYIPIFLSLFTIDFSMLSGKDLDSLETTFCHFCNYFKERLIIPIFDNFITFVITGLSQEINVIEIPVVKLSKSLNQAITVHKNENAIKCFDGNQIQLSIFLLYNLRILFKYFQSYATVAERYVPQILEILTRLTSTIFSNQLAYEAFLASYAFCSLMNFQDVFLFVEKLLQFTISINDISDLIDNYKLIKGFFYLMQVHGQLNNDFFQNIMPFFQKEFIKSNNRRDQLRKEVVVFNDCSKNLDDLNEIDGELSNIIIPFFKSKNQIDFNNFLSEISSSYSLVNIKIAYFWYILKQPSEIFFKYFVNIVLNYSTMDDEEIKKNGFIFIDSFEAGVNIFNIIYEKLVDPNLVKQTLDFFNREYYNPNLKIITPILFSLFIILQQYDVASDLQIILNLIKKTDMILSFLMLEHRSKVVKVWNNILPIFIQEMVQHNQLFDIDLVKIFIQTSYSLRDFYSNREETKTQIALLFRSFDGDKQTLLLDKEIQKINQDIDFVNV